MQPLLSIVTPLHGNLAATQEMYLSLLATLPSGTAHEIIFVDDASPDETADWLRSLNSAQVHCVFLSENVGFSKACNAGARAARGRYLLMANNDLIYKSGWLEPMLDAFRIYGNSLGLLGNVQRRVADGSIDHAGIRIGHDASLEHIQVLSSAGDQYPKRWAVTGACFMMRLHDFIALGGFDETYLSGSEDVDLCLKVRGLGMDVRVALDSQILHHVSLTRKLNSIQNEINSRRLLGTWFNEVKLELISIWAKIVAENQLEHFSAHFEGEPTSYARQLPTLTATRIANNLLAIKHEHWRHVIDGSKDHGVARITHEIYGTRPDARQDAQVLLTPDFDIEIRGVGYIRRLFILGHSDGLPTGTKLSVVVNGFQYMVWDLPEYGNFRCSIRGLITIPDAPNLLECRLNLPASCLDKIRITGLAFKAISSHTGLQAE